MADKYIHGYQEVEQERLLEQAKVIENRIFDFIDFSGVQELLEIGSGVGAQTEILLRRFPHLSITGVEYEAKQIEKANKNLANHGCDLSKVRFIQQDAMQLELDRMYDGVFICWVLEHVSKPMEILKSMKPFLQSGAKLVITEVFNSTFYTWPEKPAVMHYWKVYNEYQQSIGGDPEVGAKLGNFLDETGYAEINLRRGGFHLDKREAAEKKRVFTYWKNLMSSGAPALLEENLLSEAEVIDMQHAMDELTAQEDSIFFYRFIQATATNP